MNKRDIKRAIRNAAQTGCFATSTHCREMMEERNVTNDDFLLVLLWGDILKIKEDPEHDNYHCTIKGKDTDGDELTINIAVLRDENTVMCITVY